MKNEGLGGTFEDSVWAELYLGEMVQFLTGLAMAAEEEGKKKRNLVTSVDRTQYFQMIR